MQLVQSVYKDYESEREEDKVSKVKINRGGCL